MDVEAKEGTAAYTLYAPLFAYQFCVAAKESDSRGEDMSRYAAADVPVWDAPTVRGRRADGHGRVLYLEPERGPRTRV